MVRTLLNYEQKNHLKYLYFLDKTIPVQLHLDDFWKSTKFPISEHGFIKKNIFKEF